MSMEGHVATPSGCYQPPISDLVLPAPTAASSSSSPPPVCSFQMGMDDDLPLYHSRLFSYFQPTTVPSTATAAYSAAIHPKLEEDIGSPFQRLRSSAESHDYLPQQQLRDLLPAPLPPLFHQNHHSSFPPAALPQLQDATPQLLDEMIPYQDPDGESTTRASSVSAAGYDCEDYGEASCRATTVALQGDSYSLLAALGAPQHDSQLEDYYPHSRMLHDSAADPFLGLDAAALSYICGGARGAPFTSEEGTAAANAGYMMMMGRCGAAPAPGLWMNGADKNSDVAASVVGKRSRGHASEKQRRDHISEKLFALRALLPKSTKTDKSSIVKEATDYIKELLMIVEKLKLRICMKHSNTLNEPSAETTAHSGLLRSSWAQRSCSGTCVDVRVLEDGVNIKLFQQPRPGCLLLVARGLLEMQLELLHLTTATFGDSLVIFVNAKFQVGSSVHANFIANKLVDAVNSN